MLKPKANTILCTYGFEYSYLSYVYKYMYSIYITFRFYNEYNCLGNIGIRLIGYRIV